MLILIIGFPLLFIRTTGASSEINITAPQNGDSVQQSNVQIDGTAPASVLINITITDIDTSKALVAHQPNGRVDGSATSDDNGSWAYTPQQQLVPGQFSVQASYIDSQKQTINSPAIKFTVITVTGASEILSNDTRRVFFAGVAIVLISISALLIHLSRRRRKRRQGPVEEMREKEIEELTAERLGKRLIKDKEASEPKKDEEAKNKSEEAEENSKETDDASSPIFLRTFRGRRYQAQEDAKFKALSDKTEEIESQLGEAAEQLETANEQVVKLGEQIGKPNKKSVKTDSDEEPKITSNK